MAVIDPTYANFDYAAALRDAVAPINRLSEGQLALAQTNNARAYQTASENRRAEQEAIRQRDNAILTAKLARDNASAELTQRDAIAQAGVLRQQEADRQQRYKESGYVENPALSKAENDRLEFKQRGDNAVTNLQGITAQQQQAQSDLAAHIAGRTEPTAAQQALIEQQVRLDVSRDPNLQAVALKNPRLREALTKQPGQPGYMSVEDLLKKNPNWFTDNPQTRADILTSANAARTLRTAAVVTGNDAADKAKLAEMSGRFSSLNLALPDAIANVQKYAPNRLGEGLTPNSASGGYRVPTTTTAPNGVDVLHDVIGGPAAGQSAPVVANPAQLAATAPTVNNARDYYTAKGNLLKLQSDAAKSGIDDKIADKRKQMDEGGVMQIPRTGGGGPALPYFQPHSPEQMAQLAVDLEKLHKAKDDQESEIRIAQSKLAELPTPRAPTGPAFGLAPGTTPPPMPSNPQDPGANVISPGWTPPPMPATSNPTTQAQPDALPASMQTYLQTNTPSLAPPAPTPAAAFTPAPMPVQPAQPGAQPGTPQTPQQQQFMQKVFAIVGTNDPNVLARAKDFLHTRGGLSQDQLTQTVQAAVQGDPISQRKLKLAVMSVQNGTAEPSISPPINPQPQYGP
jgi:hypothetical protein